MHSAAATTASNAAANITGNSTTQATTQRRRKKRPNNGTRTVEVRRGYNGFGFTISGQQPCRLSCIVSNSPAEQAGLQKGDFLISVNGLNVSMLPHETVVQLIGNSFGSIRMEISDHFYLDTSDEENATAAGGLAMPSPLRSLNLSVGGARFRSRHMHSKSKQHRIKNSPQKRLQEYLLPLPSTSSAAKKTNRSALDAAKKATAFQQRNVEPKRSLSHDATPASSSSFAAVTARAVARVPLSASLEYRAVVGYMGTIEMPKQISHNSKLQTVRSCIRKLRQEKRQAPNVLMIILPACLKLQSHNGSILATYPSNRLTYVSSSSESENRYFGLVTSTIYTAEQDEVDEDEQQNDGAAVPQQSNPALAPVAAEVSISNSCHVFSVDTKLCEHQQHVKEAEIFGIDCTKDPISNLCLEFPNNSEYVVNLIRSMYTMRVVAPTAAQRSISDDASLHHCRQHNVMAGVEATSHSPQPSNHSEVSTTTSNSDSGIGYNNDCSNVTDRIVVVDFPHNNQQQRPNNNIRTATAAQSQMRSSLFTSRPQAIFHDTTAAALVTACNKQRSRANTTDLKALAYVPISNKTTVVYSRSCDDVLNLVDQQQFELDNADAIASQCYASMDDISLHAASAKNAELQQQQFALNEEQQPTAPLKLNIQKPTIEAAEQGLHNLLAGISKMNSTPDLASAETLQATPTFGRGWAQSSLRTPRADKHTLAQSFDNTAERKQQKPANISRSNSTSTATDTLDIEKVNRTSLTKQRSFSVSATSRTSFVKGTQAWAKSFESLLKDAAGLKTFAEFLKQEYAAENIYFWTACERFRNIESQAERFHEAQTIFSKHLSCSSLEPVNVDSQARSWVETNLQLADRELFLPAQKQIFNLMKFDSYQRFLRSELYKQCVLAEGKGKNLPYAAEQLDDLLKTGNFCESASTKSKKLLEDGKSIKSILPWNRKNRNKSGEKSTESLDAEIAGNAAHSCKASLTSASSLKLSTYGSKSSLTSLDPLNTQNAHNDTNRVICRVKFPDDSTTVVPLRNGETVNDMIQQLFIKRGFCYRNYDVVVRTNNSSSKTVDLQLPSRELHGKLVEIEQKVGFILYLPTCNAISVRCKARKILQDAVRNALERYKIDANAVEVFIRDTQQKPDLTQSVTAVDGKKLQVLYKKVSDYQNDVVLSKFIKPEAKKPAVVNASATANTVNDINNEVFQDLMKTKQESAHLKENAQSSFDLCSFKSEECVSENSTSFKRMRSKRDIISAQKIATTKLQKNMQLSASTGKLPALQQELKGVLNSKAKSLQKSENQDELLEDLNRAQLARLEDQRGTEINSELPAFLRNNDKNDSNRIATDRGPQPQPAPRLSISKKTKSDTQLLMPKKQTEQTDALTSEQCDSNEEVFLSNTTCSSIASNCSNNNNSNREPPPLPPKPKVLPIKPPNWGVSIDHAARSPSVSPLAAIASPKLSNANIAAVSSAGLSPNTQQASNVRCAYLDEPSSSFV